MNTSHWMLIALALVAAGCGAGKDVPPAAIHADSERPDALVLPPDLLKAIDECGQAIDMTKVTAAEFRDRTMRGGAVIYQDADTRVLVSNYADGKPRRSRFEVLVDDRWVIDGVDTYRHLNGEREETHWKLGVQDGDRRMRDAGGKVLWIEHYRNGEQVGDREVFPRES